jgi:putative NADH-flavin reductase
MRIALFGATGRTGHQVLRRGADRGYSFAALLRKPADPSLLPPGVAIIQGSLTDPETVKRTLQGADAVICAFGPRPHHPDVFCALATRTLIDAMKAQGVRRLVCLTGAMIGEYRRNRTWCFERMCRAFRRRFPELARDRDEQERAVAASDLDWTLVKPPRLTEGRARGAVRASKHLVFGLMSSIPRADLADVLLDLAAAKSDGDRTIFVRT